MFQTFRKGVLVSALSSMTLADCYDFHDAC